MIQRRSLAVHRTCQSILKLPLSQIPQDCSSQIGLLGPRCSEGPELGHFELQGPEFGLVGSFERGLEWEQGCFVEERGLRPD